MVLVVDALEGVMGVTKKAIKTALEVGNKLTLVINKIDRLILELHIPPEDAYLKRERQSWKSITPFGCTLLMTKPLRC